MKTFPNARTVYYVIFLSALTLAVFSLRGAFSNLSLPATRWSQYLIFAVLGQFVFWYLSSFAWISGVRQYSRLQLGILRGFIQCNAVAVGKYLPGKIWGLLNRGVDLKRLGLNRDQILLVNYLDQVFLLHAGFIIGGVAYASCHGPFLFTAAVLLGIASMVVVPMSHAFLALVISKVFRIGASEFLFERVTILRYSSLVTLYMLVWGVAGMVFACLYFWLFGPAFKLMPILVSANAVGIIVGFLAFFAPGGIGVREATTVVILKDYVPVEQALLLVLVYRVWTIATDVAGGVSALVLARFVENRISLQ